MADKRIQRGGERAHKGNGYDTVGRKSSQSAHSKKNSYIAERTREVNGPSREGMSVFTEPNTWMDSFGREVLRSVQKRSSTLGCRVEDFNSSRPDTAMAEIKFEAKVAEDAIAQAARNACERLVSIRETRWRAYQELRLMQWIYNTKRRPVLPDRLKNGYLVGMFGLAEGLGAGALMAADGKMAPEIGIAYGLAFAGTNLMMAGLAGFIARYFHYRTMPGALDPDGRPMRIAAWTGFAATTCFLLLLLFSAARTRATGSHNEIFDFGSVSFLATFNDSLAVALIALGVVGSVIGAIKGYSGIYDKYPGFLQAQQAAQDRSDAVADEIVDSCLDTINSTYEKFERIFRTHSKAAIREAKRYNRKLRALTKSILRHNKKIDQAQARFQAYHSTLQLGAARVTGEATYLESPFDDTDFDKERIDTSALEGHTPIALNGGGSDLLTRLRIGRDEALGLLQEAYLRFMTESDEPKASNSST